MNSFNRERVLLGVHVGMAWTIFNNTDGWYTRAEFQTVNRHRTENRPARVRPLLLNEQLRNACWLHLDYMRYSNVGEVLCTARRFLKHDK
jgi:hypothetical protein